VPQVDFYVLGVPGDGAALGVACRVVEKAWDQGLRVHVQARDEDQAARVDEALWTFRQESFVPHERCSGDATPRARVTVGTAGDTPAAPDVLVNIGAPVPHWYAACGRVAEIVAGDPQARAAGRERYRVYRDAGLELRTHDVEPEKVRR